MKKLYFKLAIFIFVLASCFAGLKIKAATVNVTLGDNFLLGLVHDQYFDSSNFTQVLLDAGNNVIDMYRNQDDFYISANSNDFIITDYKIIFIRVYNSDNTNYFYIYGLKEVLSFTESEFTNNCDLITSYTLPYKNIEVKALRSLIHYQTMYDFGYGFGWLFNQYDYNYSYFRSVNYSSYQKGFEAGSGIDPDDYIEADNVTAIVKSVVYSVQSFLDIRLGSVTLGAIILVPFSIAFAWFIIKQFRGGGA